MKKFIKIVFPPFFAALLLSSCLTTMNQARADDPGIRVKPEPLQLAPRAEVYHIRTDLVRAHHYETRTVTTGETTTTRTESVPNAYHYVSADFGNGIIYDYNGNLAIDLITFYGLDKMTSFTVVAESQIGLFRTKTTYTKEGDSFVRSPVGLFDAGSKVLFEGNTITINNGIFNGNMVVTDTGSTIAFDPHGFLGLGKVRAEMVNRDTLAFPGFWGDAVFEIHGQDEISNNLNFKVVRENDRIRFIYEGFFGYTAEYTFIKTANGFIFFDQYYYGVEVIREGDLITEIWNGSKYIVYKISSPE